MKIDSTVSPKKILILRFSSLGDIVMTTAMVRCLRTRFPNAQIDMIVREDFIDLIRDNPHLNHKFGLARKEGFKGLLTLIKTINETQYDVIYDAHRSLRTLFLMPFLRTTQKFYFQKHYIKRTIALIFKIPLLKDFGRFLERFIHPLDSIGVRYDAKGPEIFLNEATRTRAFSKVTPYQGSSLNIGLVPSAQWPGKRWPLENFRNLIQKLIAETTFHLTVLGGPEDTFVADLIKELPPERITNTQGKLKIGETAAFIERCAFVISNDTGLMHMADALQKPSLLFLGPTSAEMGCLPFHPKSIVLEHQLWCRPCSKNGQAPCIRGKRYCLTLTTPEMAFRAALQLADSCRN